MFTTVRALRDMPRIRAVDVDAVNGKRGFGRG